MRQTSSTASGYRLETSPKKISWARIKGELRKDLESQYNRWWLLCGLAWNSHIRGDGKPIPPRGRVRKDWSTR